MTAVNRTGTSSGIVACRHGFLPLSASPGQLVSRRYIVLLLLRNYGSFLAIIRGPKQLECARCRSSGVRTQRLRPCKAAVKFQIKKQVEWGDKLCLVGNHKVLGRWEADNGVELRWNDGDVWTANVKLPDNAKVEYKVVNIKGLGDPEWERGDNRSLSVGSEPVDVQLKWGKTDNGAVAPGGYEPRQLNADSDAKVGSDTSEAWSSSYESDSGEGSSDALPQNKWQGKEVRFMTENQHSKERSGVWNTDGLHGAVLDLVTSDEHSARCSPSSSVLGTCSNESFHVNPS